MNLISVEQVPEKRWDKAGKKNLRQILNEFAESDARVVRVDTDPYEYSSPDSLSESLARAITRSGHKHFKVYKRGMNVYIKKEV